MFETIRLVDGCMQNIRFHNARMNESRNTVYEFSESVNLEKIIHVPGLYKKGIIKCRIVYGPAVKNVSFEPYIPREILSLKLIDDDSVSYPHKFLNRSHIEHLFALRGSCDEILIVKNGLITDTSFSNILLFDGRQWITPATPLLKGTMRSMLLETNMITEKRVSAADLNNFSTVRLINAMLPFEAETDIPVNSISF